MNSLLIYIVKSAMYLTGFWMVYLLLSRDTSYGRNRAYILLSFFLSLILPAISIRTGHPLGLQFFGRFLNEVFVYSSSNSTEISNSPENTASAILLATRLYVAIVILFLLKLMADLLNLLILILRKKNSGSRIIWFNDFKTAGFSAMGYIFVNSRLSRDDAEEIIRHEQNHLDKRHFIDIIFVEIIKAIQWFNPVAYMLDHSLRAVHEYQADEACLSSGIPVTRYQSLLFNQVFKSNIFNLSNSFSNPSLIKKRMLMMSMKKTPARASLKMLVSIPVIIAMLFSLSIYSEATSPNNTKTESSTETIQTTGTTDDTEPFVVVEEMPSFPGGDAALLKYIAENTSYPDVAKENNIQGRVIVRFCVTSEGKTNRASIIKGVSPELDREALRVVNSLPGFIPGKQGGKNVPVWYMVPITFALR